MNDRQRAIQLLRSASTNATDQGIAGVMTLATDGTETVSFPEFADDADPRIVSVWLLGAHIKHVADASRAAGGDMTMEQAARDAIAFVEKLEE